MSTGFFGSESFGSETGFGTELGVFESGSVCLGADCFFGTKSLDRASVSGVVGFCFGPEGLDPEAGFGLGSTIGFSTGVTGTWRLLGSEMSLGAGTGVWSDTGWGRLDPEVL